MALGNANTQAQSRGKNKPVIVKRRKEIVLAKSYNTETYFYNGTASAPEAGDVVYPVRRANSRNVLEAGHYKIGPYSGRYKNMEIGSNGVVSAITNC